MVRVITCGVAAVFAASVLPSFATVLSGPTLNPATGHAYFLLSANTWTASQAEGVSLGGNLVTINDSAENDWVFDTFTPLVANEYGLWIGYNDAAVEGTFVWVSGESPVYTNWGGPDPNDSGVGGQDHTVMLSVSDAGIQPRQWGDVNEITQSHVVVHGVIEVVPEPSGGLAVCALAATQPFRRRRPRKRVRSS